MELKYYLEQLSPSTLYKILEEHGISSKFNESPNNLVNILNDKLTSMKEISLLFKDMTMEEKLVLEYFILQIPNQMLFYRKLDKLTGRLSRDKFEYGITKLRRKGIIFTLRKSWGEIAFIIPENVFILWHHFFFSSEIASMIETKTEIELAIQANSSIEEALFRFLTYIQFEEIPLTQRGTIHKKHVNKIAKEILIDDTFIKHFPLKQGAYQNYPNNISLLLEVASTLELINILDSLETTKKTINWFNLELKTQKKYLEAIIRILFKSTDILNDHLFYLIFHLPVEKWFSFKDLCAGLTKKLNRPIAKELITRAENEILMPLFAFGWLELIKDTNNNYLFKRVRNAETDSQIYVQPNFEILVPENFPHYYRLKIEQFAQLIQRDKMSKYILTKESIYKGLDNKGDIEDFINFLEKVSVIPISDNVKNALTNWALNYGAISFMDVRVLKCKTDKIANTIKENPMLKKWIIGEISTNNLIVKRDNFDELIKILIQLEYQPKKEIWSGNLIEDSIDNEEVIEAIRNREYRIENVFPSLNTNIF